MTATPPSHTKRTALGALVVASGISNIGDGVRLVAMPLLASQLTTDPRLISIVAAAGQLPWLAAPVLGLVVDRLRPIRLMSAINVLRGVIVAVLALTVAATGGHIGLLIGTALMLGFADVLADSAAQVVIPTLVADSDLESGNAKLFGAQATAALFIGPPLGAWLISISYAAPFTFDAATFAVSCILLTTIWKHDRKSRNVPLRRNIREEATIGFRWSWSDSIMRRLITVVMGLSFFDGMVGGILVLFATRNLGMSDIGYGVLLSAAALGSVAGTALTGRLLGRIRVKSLLVLSTVGAGTSYVILAVSAGPIVAGAMLAINSAMTMVWNVLTVSARQRIVPEDILGRVTTTYRMAAWGSLPVGALVGGVIAREVSVRAVIAVSGIALVALTALVIRLPAGALDAPDVSGNSTEGD